MGEDDFMRQEDESGNQKSEKQIIGETTMATSILNWDDDSEEEHH